MAVIELENIEITNNIIYLSKPIIWILGLKRIPISEIIINKTPVPNVAGNLSGEFVGINVREKNSRNRIITRPTIISNSMLTFSKAVVLKIMVTTIEV